MGLFSIAAPIVGSLIGNKMSSNAAKSAARDANQFTEDQMKNRHQWEVADLKAAGLNPILSAGGTPSMGSSAKADLPDSAGDISKGIGNSIQVALAEQQVKNIAEQTKTMKSQQSLNNASEKAAQADAILKAASAQAQNINSAVAATSLPFKQGMANAVTGMKNVGNKIADSKDSPFGASLLQLLSRNMGFGSK